MPTLAQTAPTIQWQKNLGGSSDDRAWSIDQTMDGGYIVGGTSYSNDKNVSGNHGGDDYWIARLGKNGAIQWQKSLGGSHYEELTSVQQTSDSGYILAGYSDSNDGDVSGNHGGVDCWIVKLEKSGGIEWQKTLGGSLFDEARSIRQTTDGGYVLAAASPSKDGDVTGNHGDVDYWIVKLTKNGAIQWQKSLGGSLSDEAWSIDQTTDGGYIVAGISESNDSDVSGNHGLDDYWIVKLKKNGVIQWQKSLGGSAYDDPTSIQQTSDSGYIVAGYTDSNDGDVSGNHGIGDYWIVKLDKYGGILWQKCLGGGGLDGANAIQQTADGGYVVAGYSGSNNNQVSGNNGGFDYWVVKLKKNGFIQWQESLGGSALDVATSVQQTTDSGYIVAGYSTSRDSDVSGNKGSFDFWVVKLAKDGLSPVVSQTTNLYAGRQNKNETNTSKDFTVYPNPARDILHIGTSINAVFSFLNSSGEILFTKTINDNAVINISQLPPGNYYVKNNTTGTTQKLIVER